MNPIRYTFMFYTLKTYLRLLIVALVVLFIQLSLSISPVLSQDIKIGNQVWTSKNLDVSTFRNGEAIPEAKNVKQWFKARENKIAAYCYYAYNSKNGKVYGKLYNWHAVNDPRGLAPKGYHIPTDEEWTVLTDFLVGKAGDKMKSTTGWIIGNGNNSSGFNGLPGGTCDNIGDFYGRTEDGYFWSSSEESTSSALGRRLDCTHTRVSGFNDYKSDGLSVRCIKD